jgi:hypothetical protein
MSSEGTLSDESKAKMQQFWHPRRYLIIDEFSMIAKTFLAILSENIGIGKEAAESERATLSVIYTNSHLLHNRVRSLFIGWWIWLKIALSAKSDAGFMKNLQLLLYRRNRCS